MGISFVNTHIIISYFCLLMRIIASFHRYPGYLNFIKDHISHVVLLVHVLLLSCLPWYKILPNSL